MRRVDLVVMTGGDGESQVERMVAKARSAVTRDMVDKALASGAFASIVVSTDDLALAEVLGGLPTVRVECDPEDAPFHFGQRLQWLIDKYGIERIVYLGGGSAPLLPASTLCEMAERVREADRLFLANNFYSVDFCAFTPASMLLSLDPPVNDNRLGWLLCQDAGLPARELPRTTATLFDIDTPTDLLTLCFHPDVSPRTRVYLDSLNLDTGQIETASARFLDSRAEVLVCGRISSSTMAYIEREALCRSRIFSEERGMRANRRLERGEVCSLLGMYLAHVGVETLFQEVVPKLGQAAFLDDRVLWAHAKIWPSASDRFHSDLFRPQDIVDPFIRRFTEAAMACPIPVVLGGHSLVSGGLRVLIDAVWARSGLDVQRLVEIA